MLCHVIYKGKVRCVGNYLDCVSFIQAHFPRAIKTDGHDVWWAVDGQSGNVFAATIDPVSHPG